MTATRRDLIQIASALGLAGTVPMTSARLAAGAVPTTVLPPGSGPARVDTVVGIYIDLVGDLTPAGGQGVYTVRKSASGEIMYMLENGQSEPRWGGPHAPAAHTE